MTMKYYHPDTFKTQNSLGYLLKINHALIHDCAERIFATQDISFIQWVALNKLKEGAALTASELCRQMRHDNGALTRIIDQLEELGYLERQRSQQDRRVVDLQITPAGEAKIKDITPQVVDNLNAALDTFSLEEFTELTRLLDKLKNRLQAYAEEQSSRESP